MQTVRGACEEAEENVRRQTRPGLVGQAMRAGFILCAGKVCAER